MGRSLHEEPYFIQSFYVELNTRGLSEGQVIPIEPFQSRPEGTVTADDGCTLLTGPKNRSDQHEPMMVITNGKPIGLTL